VVEPSRVFAHCGNKGDDEYALTRQHQTPENAIDQFRR
jgi:hypothetical protein